MTTLLYSHASFGSHEVPPGHVEHPGRFKAVATALSREEFGALDRREAPVADPHATLSVHSETHAEAIVSKAPASGMAQFDADTFMGPTSLDAVRRAVGAGIAAVDSIYAGEAKNAFIAARPPGHHAEPDRAMGFCFFNSAAIAARHARSHGAEHVAVVDFDVHHGNGTEAAFWDDENAFFASSHEWPQYPGTGRVTDTGASDNIVNAPLATGEGSEAFRRAWGDRILPALSDFDPDIIVISAGFDAHAADPLGGLNLLEEDYAWITAEIGALAAQQCEGRLVSFMEGGYDVSALAESAATHVKVLMDL